MKLYLMNILMSLEALLLTHTYTNTQLEALHTHMQTHIHSRTHMHTHLHLSMHTHTGTHTHTCTPHAHTCTHINK
jgi:hypothetical protein